MLLNYIKVAFRNLLRSKFHTVINVFGLSIGFVCAILILLYIDDELSYDKHHKKHERIYRLETRITSSNTPLKTPWTPHPLAPTLKDEYPEISEFVRFYQFRVHGRYKEKPVEEDMIFFADETVFNIFTHRFLQGSPETALKEPDDLVLTESLADKYFDKENPIGKIIHTREGYNFRVTAVIEDLPDNSHLKYDGLISMAGIAQSVGRERFNSRNSLAFWKAAIFMQSYVLLHENADINNVTGNFDWFEKKYYAPVGRLSDSFVELMATPLAATHFSTGFQSDFPTSNIFYVYIFATVAVFILLIASINYMNMATAQSEKRAKEIGIRKSMGAQQGQIIRQFLTESLIISMIAMVVSILLSEALLPLFNQISGKNLKLFSTDNASIFMLIMFIGITVGFISGGYPALYLSRIMPARILKNSANGSVRSGVFRKTLVCLQIFISIIMIIGTLLVSEQLKYLKNKHPGFDKDNVMMIPVRNNLDPNSLDAFKSELLRSPLIEKVAMSSNLMGFRRRMYGFIIEKDGQHGGVILNNMDIDDDYLDLMGIKIKEGRDFSNIISEGRYSGFIVNEALAEKYGYGNEAIGERIQLVEGSIGGENLKGEVIGVVNDFNFGSLHNAVEPFVFMYTPWFNVVNVRIKPGTTAEAIRFVKETRKSMNLDSPMVYYFLDDILSRYYSYEEKLDRVFRYFSLICVFISCLGLLGLSSYIAEQRTKEVGIRKVMGASVSNIVALLSIEFIKLSLIANILAWPIAYYAVTKWLEEYPYRIDISTFPFIIAGILSLLIILLTVGFQAYKAAIVNPTQSLRYE